MTITQVNNGVMWVALTSNNVRKAVTSQSCSKRYMNTMIRASIVNILYHRLDIDNKEFLNKRFENIHYKTFRPKSKNNVIRQFHAYMHACKDAVDRGYLKEFFLFFIDVATGDVLENYKFTFQYAAKNEPHQEQSGTSLIESTREMLRNLEGLGKLKRCKTEVQVKIELTYFDDTPKEYEPPNCRGIDESDCFIKKINNRGNSVIFGTLFTGYHMLKCRGKGPIFDFSASPTPTNVSEDLADNIIGSDAIEIEDTPENTESMVANRDIFTEDYSEKDSEECPLRQENEKQRLNCTYMSSISVEEVFYENCLCKSSDTGSVVLDQIKCDECSRIFHAPCVGYLDSTFLKDSFKCSNCYADIHSISKSTIGVTPDNPALHRLRLIIGLIYKYGETPRELKLVFPETLVNLQRFKLFKVEKTEIVDVNKDLLSSLFRFEHKQPDLSKFKKI